MLLKQALVKLFRPSSSNGGFEFRILSVRGGHFGEEPIRHLLEKASRNKKVIFTEDPNLAGGIHFIVEGPPNLYHLSECGPEDVPWAQYSAEPGSLYSDDDWCSHYLDPVFRIDTSRKYLEHTKSNTNFIWSPYASAVTEGYLRQRVVEARRQVDHWRERPNFLVWIASNCHSESRTFALTQMLEVARERNISDFHSLGGCMPNTNISIPSRDSGWAPVIDIYKKYRFVISFENTIEPGYVTEKLVTALAGGAIPVYYGDGDAARMIFPDDVFIDVRDIWQATGRGRDEETPNSTHWREIFEFLLKLDNDATLEKVRSLHQFPSTTSLRSVPPGLVPFPSQELSKETVKEISDKISRIIQQIFF